MAVASAEAEAPEVAGPPIRIRTLLLLGLLAGAAYTLYPRAVAAWKLHAAASALANYAVCMAGPTGPARLRDKPEEFRELVRRRLLAADANDRPFSECARAAQEITGSVEVERAHHATAWAFVEYGGGAADTGRGLTLDALRVTTKPVADLSQQAWPFSRGGWTRLMRPSMGAREAIHPVEPPVPAAGSGLPAWRVHYENVAPVPGGHVLALGRGANLAVFGTKDNGLHWSPAPTRAADAIAERCGVGERHFTIGRSDDGKLTLVASLGPDAPPSTTPLATAEREVFAAACDDGALVAAVKAEDSRDVSLLVCRHRERCAPMPLPRFSGVGTFPRFPLDVARLDGATVIAVVMHGIVRVASSRDDGKSWTPFAVAFDPEAAAGLRTSVKTPTRLLAVGKRVLLHGVGKKPKDTYPVLVSDDLGASWRAP